VSHADGEYAARSGLGARKKEGRANLRWEGKEMGKQRRASYLSGREILTDFEWRKKGRDLPKEGGGT